MYIAIAEMSVNLPISSYIFEIIVTQIQYDVKKEKLIVLFAITLPTQQIINLYPMVSIKNFAFIKIITFFVQLL